ncbi:auxin-induced protein 22D-like [Carica papaya]|uniref:auxin-induced protein 22D-like n=1 Tax=Carica papaya TaxID=3649 RepID=UPI000B8C985C|nr:auxin-induced protein 22D-like [Carica papaya]
MRRSLGFGNDDDLNNLKATELRLGLPGSEVPDQKSQSITTSSTCSILRTNKRASPENSDDFSRSSTSISTTSSCVSNAKTPEDAAPPAKAQIVGWPPIRSYRKNSLQVEKRSEGDGAGMFVKVSVDGAPYLRKIDLKVYKSYADLLKALQNMFKLKIGEYSEREGYNGSDYSPTYEDKDGDWMLVGDVPWEMFISTCKRLRIMKGSEARGLTFL